MLIKEGSETNNRVSLGLKCGECMHLQRGPAAFEKKCIELGKASFSDACPNFTPDLVTVSFIKKGHLELLAEVFNAIMPKQARLLAYTFRNIDFIKRAGFEFGEQVVFSLGADHLECFVRARIIGSDRTGEQLYLCSDFETLNGGSAFMTVLRQSVLSMKDFAKKRKQLIVQGRIAEPRPAKGSSRRTVLQCLKMTVEERALYRKELATRPDQYMPPSIDTVPAKWLDARELKPLVDPKLKLAKTKKGLKTDEGFSVRRYNDKPSINTRPTVKKSESTKSMRS
jgi:hypothetical protein